MTASTQKGNHSEPNRTKLYTVLGTIIVILVAALLLWDHGFFQKSTNVTAATIGEQTFDVAEVTYYYSLAYNNTYNMAQLYAQYGLDSGYDTSLSPEEQFFDEEAGKTYADYFRETALNNLQQIYILNDQAKKDNYQLSEDGIASVSDQMKQLDNTLLQYNAQYGGKKTYYLKMMYGEHMTTSLMKHLVTDATLANEYAEWRANQFTYDEDQVNTYYEENATDLDSYDYRVFRIAAEIETTVDEDGNQVAPTEEETAAAMDIAKRSAEKMATRVKRGEDFNTVAMDYADEETTEALNNDASYTLMLDSLGSSLPSAYATWLKDDARKENNVGVLKEDNSAYYVVEFLQRERRDNSYETVDVQSILIQAETTETTDEQGNTVTKPTEEQLAAARAKADEILAQWDAQADKNADSFLALAPKKSDGITITAETLSDVSRNTYGTDFDKWAFTPDATTIGTTTIIESTDSAGNINGYRIVYLNDFGQARWLSATESALRNADYATWYAEQKENYPITEADGMAQVGAKTEK